MNGLKFFLNKFLLVCFLFCGLVPALYASDAVYKLNLTRIQFNLHHGSNTSAGRQLMDIDVRWTGSEERYNAIWYPSTDTVHTLIQGTTTDWNDFISEMAPKNGRYLDVDVGYFDGTKRYSALFYENGDDYSYALRTTNDDATFQAYLAQYLNAGYAIIDFEAYTDNSGNTKYAGVWVKDPNQPMTSLYYGLESAEVSDLISPRIGRVIDIEHYYSAIHGENRWAMVFAMDSGGEQFQRRGDTAATINTKDLDFSDGNTHIIDVESYDSGGGDVRYIALWGDTYKSLHEVDRIAADSDPQAIPVAVTNLINQFETAANPDVIGFYAKNMRSNQSMGYRADEPFYVASTAKIPIHVKYWREIQRGHLDGTTTFNYTTGANSRTPWYTGHRADAASGNALGTDDFGQSFSLQQYDTFMMNRSDNAATSLLMDEPTIGLTRDSYDVNEWLADISGVGQGWGLVTSIQDVDRNIMWQGQVNDFPTAASYFLAPPSALEAHFRWNDCNSDTVVNSLDDDCWGDLQAFYGVTGTNNLPQYSRNIGTRRYFAQGLNTATPKAVALLLERLAEGSLLDATTTQNAITSMTEGTTINGAAGWPGYINVWAKGGSKGRGSANLQALSNVGIIALGPDAITVAITTEWNGGTNNAAGTFVPTNNVRGVYVPQISLSLLQALSPDLGVCNNASFQSPSTLTPGQLFQYGCFPENVGGGDALSFEVHFYASSDTIITQSDTYLGKTVVQNLPGGGSSYTEVSATLPVMPAGDYHIGWIVDPLENDNDPRCVGGAPVAPVVPGAPPGANTFGAVGEFNECNNFGFDGVNKLTVLALDLTSPTIDIRNEPAIVSDTSPYNVTFEFSEEVNGFTLSDITVGNGSADHFVVIDTDTYTADITPSGSGHITIDVMAGSAQDGAGNGNIAAPQSVTEFDNTSPTVMIRGVPETIINTTAFNITVEFSENVTGFTSGDIVLSNATASHVIAVNDSTYSATITPLAADDVTINVPESAGQDGANNSSIAATQVTVIFNDAPVFTSPAYFPFTNMVATVAQVTAMDDENDTITFSIVGGEDQVRFTMSQDGLLDFINPPDTDNPGDFDGNNEYLITIQAFDGFNTTDQSLAIRADKGASCDYYILPVTLTIDNTVNPPITKRKIATVCL